MFRLNGLAFILAAVPTVTGAVAEIAGRQNGGCTTTVPAKTYTYYQESDVVTYYTTTPVTVYAMQASTESPSSISQAKRQTGSITATPYTPSQEALAPTSTGCPNTVTPSAVWVTASTTYTYSEAARSTSTMAACEASSNYNYFNGTLNINSKQFVRPVGEPHTKNMTGVSMGECCDACFADDNAGCLQWTYGDDGTCMLDVFESQCPNGVGETEAIAYVNTDEKPAIGFGPCLVLMEYFQDG